MWTDSCEASLSQKTEVKQIGLDFPVQHRQSTCCEAPVWMAFDPRNLLIRMGQCVRMLLLVDPAMHQLLSLSFFPTRLYIQKCQLPVTVAVLLLFISQFESMKLLLFAHNPNTSASTHGLISPCRPSCVTHSSCVAVSSVCFDAKAGLLTTTAATTVIQPLMQSQHCRSVVVCLTSFHFRLLMVGAKWFHSHTLTIDTCEGGKTPETHHTVLLRLTEIHANIIFFPRGIFFLVLIHSSLTQTRKSLSH